MAIRRYLFPTGTYVKAGDHDAEVAAIAQHVPAYIWKHAQRRDAGFPCNTIEFWGEDEVRAIVKAALAAKEDERG